jgi:GT2 family glycosyltransferase
MTVYVENRGSGRHGGVTGMTGVGVAIVSYNTSELLYRCLRSLQAVDMPVRIAVVDNGSKDDSVAMVRREFPDVRLLATGENHGFAKGTNIGIRCLQEQWPELSYVLMLNPDTEVRPGAIERLVAFLEQHPRVGVVSPRLENPDGSVQRAAFRFPTPMMTFLDLFPPGEVMPGRWYDSWLHGRYPQEGQTTAAFAIDHPLGACMLTRPQVLAQVGMLDERYHMYVEEVDWCRRVRDAGWAIWQEPQACVMHVGGASSRQFRAFSTRAIWQSRQRYWAQWCTPRERFWHHCWLRLGMWRLRWMAWRAYQRGELAHADYVVQRDVYRSIGQ